MGAPCLLTGFAFSSIKAAAFCIKSVEDMDNITDNNTEEMEKTIIVAKVIVDFFIML
jgi:hypothetical protein